MVLHPAVPLRDGLKLMYMPDGAAHPSRADAAL